MRRKQQLGHLQKHSLYCGSDLKATLISTTPRNKGGLVRICFILRPICSKPCLIALRQSLQLLQGLLEVVLLHASREEAAPAPHVWHPQVPAQPREQRVQEGRALQGCQHRDALNTCRVRDTAGLKHPPKSQSLHFSTSRAVASLELAAPHSQLVPSNTPHWVGFLLIIFTSVRP